VPCGEMNCTHQEVLSVAVYHLLSSTLASMHRDSRPSFAAVWMQKPLRAELPAADQSDSTAKQMKHSHHAVKPKTGLAETGRE